MDRSLERALNVYKPTLGALKSSLVWQQHVVDHGRTLEQIKRAQIAVDRLKLEIAYAETRKPNA